VQPYLQEADMFWIAIGIFGGALVYYIGKIKDHENDDK
jgi:hypothetical protein